MSGSAMYYLGKDGKKQDADLHEPMLKTTPKEVLEATQKPARELGLTEEQIIHLYGK